MKFSERQKLSDEYYEWRLKNDVADVAMNVISFLDSRGLICDKSESDAVSRQVVKEQMIKYGFNAPDMTVTEFVEDLLSVTPTRPKGQWRAIYQGDEIIDYRCSECEFGSTFGKSTYRMNYCPNCGAHMKDGE